MAKLAALRARRRQQMADRKTEETNEPTPRMSARKRKELKKLQEQQRALYAKRVAAQRELLREEENRRAQRKERLELSTIEIEESAEEEMPVDKSASNTATDTTVETTKAVPTVGTDDSENKDQQVFASLVRASGGAKVVGGQPFVPEVWSKDQYYPGKVCSAI